MSTRVLFGTSELSPWAKTGGLGEVARDLPQALARAGAEVRILVPAWPALRAAHPTAKPVARFESTSGTHAPAQLLYVEGNPGLLLVECDDYYARPGTLYQSPEGSDWPDNHLRFGLLSRVAARLAGAGSPLEWRPDVLHCNDWQCGLAPAWRRIERGSGPRGAATIMTVHNLAYQGLFPREVLVPLGLPASAFTFDGLEFYGQLSFLKAGLRYADLLSTVSPTYAREIQGETLGFGLNGLLSQRANDLAGILNGIDTEVWNPATDPHLERPYDAENLGAKGRNKWALQADLGIEEAPERPLLGMVARLVEQKGADLVLEAAPQLVAMGCQLALLGSGEKRFEEGFAELARDYPASVGVKIGFDEALSHRIEAGADLFLMPSRFEPCGLNQMYSMRYGTPPVVRRTGGLADSVVDHGAAGEAAPTGFVFDEADADALVAAIERAFAVYRSPTRWQALQRSAMARDAGWDPSAAEYLALYRRALARA
ncbi:MAG TPA: glycogen synthase GlgA [Burkholderiales bacterium]